MKPDTFKAQTKGATLLITCSDSFTLESESLFKHLVETHLTEAHQCVDVDLSHTDLMDSVGLGMLIWLLKRVGRHEGRVRLLNPPIAIRRVLDLTRLHRLFEVVES